MLEQHLRSDLFGPLQGGERVLWRGRAGVAEYAFDQAGSLPRWTLPESTEVLVTDRRLLYAFAAEHDALEITSGELRWLWPQHLRVQPGARDAGRAASATQVQLVCGSGDGSFPALVFAGGDLTTVGDADKLANVLRQAIARFRLDNGEKLGLTTPQSRMLSRLVIGPEFSNYPGGPGQTVSLQGAMSVSRPAPADLDQPVAEPEPAILDSSILESLIEAEPVTAPPASAEPLYAPEPDYAPAAEVEPVSVAAAADGTRVMINRPGLAADAARAWQAARAEEVTQQAQPDLASRAAELAARVADLVSQAEPEAPAPGQSPVLSPDDPGRFDVPTINLSERAETLRRSAARYSANSTWNRSAPRSADRETGVTTRGNRNR
jgi:hypothetical protein